MKADPAYGGVGREPGTRKKGTAVNAEDFTGRPSLDESTATAGAGGNA